MSRLGLASALIAAGMLHGLARAETPEEREARAARDKQPPPDRLPPTRITRPKYASEVTGADLDRLTAAIAKRERRAAKRLRDATSSGTIEADQSGDNDG